MKINKEQMIGQGNTAEIYRLGDNKILKLFRNGLYKGIIELEYQNVIAIQQFLDCVPKAYDMLEVEGRYGIIYQEVKGTDMQKDMLTSAWKINDYIKKLAQYHRSIQITGVEKMVTVKEKLEGDINNVAELSDETKEIVRNYLRKLPDGNELCHFDLHPGNIMLTENKVYVLDWMTACSGDGCADIARTSIMLKYGVVPNANWIMRKLIPIFQHYISKVYIKEYLKLSKRTMEEINQWELPVAAARLREWIPESEKQVLIQLVKKYCEKL